MSMKNKARAQPKTLDLVIYGATGYTGRLVLEQLVKELEFTPQLRWAIAGRNRRKLKDILVQLGDMGNVPMIMVAENSDKAALANMVRNAHTVLNLAGPYFKHGSKLIEACIEHECHYLDLSVESFWISDIIRKHHGAAFDRHIKLAPGCGYESLPFDMACSLAARELMDRFGERCVSANVMVKFNGRALRNPKNAFSGGTYASIAAFLDAPNVRIALEPGCLVEDPDRADYLRKNSPFNLFGRYEADFKATLAPCMPIPFINPAMVYRSAEIQRHYFADHFLYREGMSVSAALPFKLLEKPAAMVLGFGFNAFQRMLQNNVPAVQYALKRAIETIAPTTGQGPSRASLDELSYEIEVIATGESGSRMKCVVTGEGHAGYRSTANMAVQAALALAMDEFGSPRYYGVITPATALGPAGLKRLERAGVHFDLYEMEPLKLAVNVVSASSDVVHATSSAQANEMSASSA